MSEPRPYASDVMTFITKVTEEDDEFIFRHLQQYCEGMTSVTGITHVPKQLLIRALICFKEEHKDEYNFLMGRKPDLKGTRSNMTVFDEEVKGDTNGVHEA